MEFGDGVDCNFMWYQDKRSYLVLGVKHLNPNTWCLDFISDRTPKSITLFQKRRPYDTIPHSVTSCINKIQPRKYNWVCPDELENQPPENEQPENEPEDDSDQSLQQQLVVKYSRTG